MCVASSECAAGAACVAGRCQTDRPNVRASVDGARRVVVRPVDMAYVRRGSGVSESETMPPIFALGRDGAVLYLRFEAPLPKTATLIEAYLVLRRTDVVDEDPTPLSLHATRIVEGWNSRSISWAQQPKTAEGRSPATRLEPGGRSLVRLDVRDLVQQWAKRDRRDAGLAVVADSDTVTGTWFATSSAAGAAPDVEPYLELYLR